MNFKAMRHRKLLKHIVFPVLAIPVLICSYQLRAQKKQASPCLELSGRVISVPLNQGEKIQVYLIEENRVIDSLSADAETEFRFYLMKDRYYAVRIKQNGCLTRLISVSTFLPPDLRPVNAYRFHFDLYSISNDETNSELDDLLDFPIALIRYDEVKGYFDYNAHYTTHIKKAYQKLKPVGHNDITTL